MRSITSHCSCTRDIELIAVLKAGRIVELIEALEAMAKDNQSIPARAMILSTKYRTLVSSWIEPLQEEAELGFEIDYIARCVHWYARL